MRLLALHYLVPPPTAHAQHSCPFASRQDFRLPAPRCRAAMPIAGAMQCPAVLSNTFLAHRRGSESCAQPRCQWPRRRAKNAAWSSQPGYHRQILANSYEQGLRHVQPPGPAAASGSRGAEADTAKTLLSWGRWPAPGRKSRMCSAATAKPIVSVMAPRYALHSVAS